MNQNPSNDDPDELAADWAARLDAGPLTPGDTQTLEHWLASDTANRRRLDEFLQLHGTVRSVLPAMIAAGQVKAVETASPRRVKPRAHLALWASSLVAALVVLGFWWVEQPAHFATTAAETQSVTLSDGTRAELNAQTSLEVRIRGTERKVRLRGGEVFFTVAKDATRPFVIETEAGRVRVTGTVFNLRAESPGALVVTVVEGSVVVTPKTSAATENLIVGDELSIEGVHVVKQQLAANDLEDSIAWRDGRIVFHDSPLRLALQRFARHHGRQVEVSAEVADLQLGGRFKLDDFEAFLRDVEVALPVQILRGENGHLRVVAR